MYKLKFLPGARRYFKKVKDKRLKSAFRRALLAIQSNPYSGQAKTGDLRGLYGFDVYHDKVNYEITYRIYTNDDHIVVVILAGTRENFYQELRRYMK